MGVGGVCEGVCVWGGGGGVLSLISEHVLLLHRPSETHTQKESVREIYKACSNWSITVALLFLL